MHEEGEWDEAVQYRLRFATPPFKKFTFFEANRRRRLELTPLLKRGILLHEKIIYMESLIIRLIAHGYSYPKSTADLNTTCFVAIDVVHDAYVGFDIIHGARGLTMVSGFTVGMDSVMRAAAAIHDAHGLAAWLTALPGSGTHCGPWDVCLHHLACRVRHDTNAPRPSLVAGIG